MCLRDEEGPTGAASRDPEAGQNEPNNRTVSVSSVILEADSSE